jgi:hypothetical protein
LRAGIKLFRYSGGPPLATLAHAQLFDARFRPAPPGMYPDRALSPERLVEAKAAAAAPSAKVGAYRPPGSSGRLAAMMRAERSDGPAAGKIAQPFATASRSAQQLPVGMAPLKESNAAKNK